MNNNYSTFRYKFKTKTTKEEPKKKLIHVYGGTFSGSEIKSDTCFSMQTKYDVMKITIDN